MRAVSALLLILPVVAVTQPVPTNRSLTTQHLQSTLFVNCPGSEKPKRLLSPVSFSEDRKWRAYVQVDVQPACVYTTRLWVNRANGAYRLIYLMPPQCDASENGMEILGWAKKSRMLLLMTEQWQYGSDASDRQQVLAIDAGSGMVYEPNLEAMLEERKGKQCWFRVTDAGFSTDKNVNILVRAHFSTFLDPDETEEDIPPSKRCDDVEETWSFDFATGEIKRVGNTESLQIFKK